MHQQPHSLLACLLEGRTTPPTTLSLDFSEQSGSSGAPAGDNAQVKGMGDAQVRTALQGLVDSLLDALGFLLGNERPAEGHLVLAVAPLQLCRRLADVNATAYISRTSM